jgi:hypothetical protein
LEIVDAHINDDAFVEVAVDTFRATLGRRATAAVEEGS